MSAPAEPVTLPPDAILAVDPEVLAGNLLAIPDGDNAILRLADGRRTVKGLAEEAGGDRDEVLRALARLLDVGVLRVVAPGGPVSARPGPEGTDWFASPSTSPGTEAVPGSAEAMPPDGSPAAPEAPGVVVIAPPAGAGPSRAWAIVATAAACAVLLGAVVRAWQRPSVPAPSTESRVATPAPPALAVTEPAPSASYRDALAEAGARAQAGDLAGAAAASRRAIAIDPAIGAGWLSLGEVLLASGDTDGAREALGRSLEREPEGPQAPRARALLERLRP